MYWLNKSNGLVFLSALALGFSVAAKADTFIGKLLVPLTLPDGQVETIKLETPGVLYDLKIKDAKLQQYAMTLHDQMVEVEGMAFINDQPSIPEYGVIAVRAIKPHGTTPIPNRIGTFCETVDGKYAAVVYPGKALVLKEEALVTELACDTAFPTTTCHETNIVDAGYVLELGELWSSGSLYELWIGGRKPLGDVNCR